MKSIVLPVLIVALGIGWLLTVKDILPGIDWIWVLGLGVTGVLVMAVGGVNKFTMFLGPLLILSTVFSLLRQTGRLSIDVEIPCLVIAIGVLLLLVRLLPIPAPDWILESQNNKERQR